MTKPKTRNTVPFAMKIDAEVYMRFRSYAEKLGQSYTVCLERIITEQLDQKGFSIEEARKLQK
jgi:hypothetical protein